MDKNRPTDAPAFDQELSQQLDQVVSSLEQLDDRAGPSAAFLVMLKRYIESRIPRLFGGQDKAA